MKNIILKHITYILGFVVIGHGGSLLAASDGGGLQTAIAVDAVGAFKADKDSAARDSFDIREAELTFYAPIDHIFDGKLSLAAHRESGVSLFEVHEATIGSSKLIPHSSFRIGQYFLGIGRLNRFHRHDWLFISAPKVYQEFFGNNGLNTEGVLDSGAEYSFLVPSSLFINITAGVTNGWVYGHAHDEGDKPKQPTHYVRVSTFLEPSDDIGVALGANYLSRKSADGTEMTLYGIDGISKWSAGSYNMFLIQGEAWQRQQQLEQGSKDVAMGSYLFPQYGFSKNLSVGCRFDYYTVTSLKDATGRKVHNADYAVVLTLTYKTSEFMTFKLDYNHETSTQAGQDDKTNRIIEFQTTFILGAHPAHDF